MRINRSLIIMAPILLTAVFVRPAAAGQGAAAEAPGKGYKLERAIMCESIEDYSPRNAAAVFSVTVGKVSCYTAFTDIPAATTTTQKWYRRDELITTKRLTLKPPHWATYSTIQLREADKGPWRVEVLDQNDKIIKILRFSVTE